MHRSVSGSYLFRESWKNFFPVLFSVILLCVLGALFGCANAPVASTDNVQNSSIKNKSQPQWVIQHTPHANVALVFVHGIFGDTLETWANQNGTSFFNIVENIPNIGQGVDIFAFGYTSNMFSSGSLDIQEASDKLNEYLKYNKVDDYRQIVFVAHSMGGLVVLRELLTHRELLTRTPVVVFFSTPQEGSEIAAIAKYIAHNPALEQMLPADKNGYLTVIDSEWKSLPYDKRPRVNCAYETKPTHGIQIVGRSSATRFCDGAALAIGEDHLGIVKPMNAQHDSVIVLINALNDYVFEKKVGSLTRSVNERNDSIEEEVKIAEDRAQHIVADMKKSKDEVLDAIVAREQKEARRKGGDIYPVELLRVNEKYNSSFGKFSDQCDQAIARFSLLHKNYIEAIRNSQRIRANEIRNDIQDVQVQFQLNVLFAKTQPKNTITDQLKKEISDTLTHRQYRDDPIPQSERIKEIVRDVRAKSTLSNSELAKLPAVGTAQLGNLARATGVCRRLSIGESTNDQSAMILELSPLTARTTPRYAIAWFEWGWQNQLRDACQPELKIAVAGKIIQKEDGIIVLQTASLPDRQPESFRYVDPHGNVVKEIR